MSAERPVELDVPRESCPLCDGNLRRFDRDFRGRTIDRCAACDLRLMNPRYSDAYLSQFYATYLSQHPTGSRAPKRYSKSHPETRRENKWRALEWVREFASGPRLLSIGSGDGLELEVAREMGWQVEGYDIDPEVTAEVSARVGVPVHCGAIDSLELADATFDAVFMDQVLEHLTEPRLYLSVVHRLLRPGGLLFVGVPNIGSVANTLKTWISRAGLREWKRGNHYATKHHLLYFTPRSLRANLERHGFEVMQLRGSRRPQRNLLTAWFSRWLPSLDSGIIALCRARPLAASAEPVRSGQRRSAVG